jgi:hypothetical protein
MTSIAPFARRFKNQLQTSAAFDLVDHLKINAACRAAGHRWRSCFWTPATTILTFLRQILNANCPCRQAVAMTLASAATQADAGGVAGDPSAYSQARQKLPATVLEALNRRIVQDIQGQAGAWRRWCGRCVAVVDGSSTSMPDAAALQAVFPQPSGQKPGCGFPVMRLLVIFCWASGCLLEWAADSLHVSELTLLRRLLNRLTPGTVLLGDTYYSSYYDLILLQQHGLEGVFRLHQRRPRDLRCGTRLGPGDHLITWTRPKIPPRGLSAAEWAGVPETLTVRHVRAAIDVPGFRGRRLDLVTTLLDPMAFPVEELARLYRDRWLAELNLRSLKTTLGMEVLKGQSVAMVRKELFVYQLAYNLIRLLMWRAARTHAVDVRRLSFAGTQQRIMAVLPCRAMCRTAEEQNRLALHLLAQIARDVIPHRPDRLEPRAVKRRPKNYRRLTKPRHQARQMAYFING